MPARFLLDVTTAPAAPRATRSLRSVVALVAVSLLVACGHDDPSTPPAPRIELSAPPPLTSAAPVADAVPVAAAPSASAAPRAPSSLVREEREIVVEGKKERWRLAWQSAPAYDCFDSSCPCENIRFGERGPLVLVRAREGAAEQRLDLGERSLQRWPVFEADGERARGAVDTDLPLVQGRPVVTLMHFGDYDHDGRAAELVLDRGDTPCSTHSAIVVGSIGKGGALGILSVAGRPDTPIDLNGRSQWETLRRASAAQLAAGVELVQVGCGNHGSAQEVSYLVRRVAGGLDVTVRRYGCDAEDKRLPGFATSAYQGEGGR